MEVGDLVTGDYAVAVPVEDSVDAIGGYCKGVAGDVAVVVLFSEVAQYDAVLGSLTSCLVDCGLYNLVDVVGEKVVGLAPLLVPKSVFFALERGGGGDANECYLVFANGAYDVRGIWLAGVRINAVGEGDEVAAGDGEGSLVNELAHAVYLIVELVVAEGDGVVAYGLYDGGDVCAVRDGTDDPALEEIA